MAQRINPESIRLLKKYSWINNWFIDFSKKNNYTSLFYKDLLIKNLILNSLLAQNNTIKYHEDILYDEPKSNNDFTLDHLKISQFYLNKSELTLFSDSTENNIITEYIQEKKLPLFIKFFYSDIYSYRNGSFLKLYYIYYLNQEFLFDLSEELVEINNKRNSYIENKLIYYIYRSNVEILYYLQNNLEFFDLTNVSLIYIRKFKFSKTLKFLMTLIISYLSQKYKITESFEIFLKKIFFHSLIKPWKGFKITISGKPHQKLRKTTITHTYGSFKSNTLDSNLIYLTDTTYNTHGAYGIKIWMLLNKVNKTFKLSYKLNNEK